MDKLIFLFIFSIGFFSISFHANCQQERISEEKLISGNIKFPLNEPHLIIDPNDPNHLLVAAILTEKWEEGKTPQSYIVLLQSWNGGKEWKEKHFNTKVTLGADPWLAMNKKGTLILTALNRLSDQRNLNLTVFISKDGGKNWDEDFLNLGFAHDRQSVVVDPVTQGFIIASAKYNRNADNKNIGGIMVTKLASDGSFSEANWHAVSNIDKNNGVPMILPSSQLIIPFVDYMVNDKMLQTRRSWLIKSDDLGRSFSEPVLISEGGKFPHVVLDTSVVKSPKLHYLKRKGSVKEYLGYKVISSVDFGYTWGEEIEVDQFVGEDPYIRGGQPVINSEGTLGVFWFDGRNTKKGGHNLYFTYLKDKMESFQKPIKISTETSFPNPEVNGMVDKRWPVGGDYFGLAATPEGKFRVVWVDYRNGRPQLFHALVEVL